MQGGLPYSHCLNCGTELKGRYCHHCGQEAVSKTPSIGAFVLEYINNAFIWDAKFFSTLWTMIRRPGQLTNEYNAGKFRSQEHPLKLNMFLLFVIATLFVLFDSADKMTNSMHSLTNGEQVFCGIQVQTLVDDSVYAQKMQESPRDTILLQAPLFLVENYPQVISNIETKEDTGGKALDKFIAVLPRVLVEEEFVVNDGSGCYHFNAEKKLANFGVDLLNSIWEEMVGIASRYFPLLLLLTVPFLSFSLRVVQRKSRIPGINHFIFALHYTAFLEVLMLCFCILHIVIAAPMLPMEHTLLAIITCLYLTIAYHRVYPSSWVKSVVKSLLTSLTYFIILLLIFVAIFVIACSIIVFEMA